MVEVIVLGESALWSKFQKEIKKILELAKEQDEPTQETVRKITECIRNSLEEGKINNRKK
jgi:hypothetical protein